MRLKKSSGRSERDEQFHNFVAARRPQLVRTATLLTAGDPHLAEDLVQATLTKVYLAWTAVQRADNPDAYLRRALVNTLTDERRRIWRSREKSVPELPDVAERPADAAGNVDEALKRALRELPPKMRAAVVFRYFYDLDVAQTAHALDCSEGTVKSQTSRALDRLRAVLEKPNFLAQGVTS